MSQSYDPHFADIGSGLATGISAAGTSIAAAIDYHTQQAKLAKTTKALYETMHPEMDKDQVEGMSLQELQGKLLGEGQQLQRQQQMQQIQQTAIQLQAAKARLAAPGNFSNFMSGGGASLPANDPNAMMAAANGAAPAATAAAPAPDTSDPMTLISGMLKSGYQPEDVDRIMTGMKQGGYAGFLKEKSAALGAGPEGTPVEGGTLYATPGSRGGMKFVPAVPAVGAKVSVGGDDFLVHTGNGKYEPWNAKTGFNTKPPQAPYTKDDFLKLDDGTIVNKRTGQGVGKPGADASLIGALNGLGGGGAASPPKFSPPPTDPTQMQPGTTYDTPRFGPMQWDGKKFVTPPK